MVTKPGFLTVGNIVKVQHWYGEIVDVAVTDAGRVMVLVKSPKGIWRNHPDEWLEYIEGQIMPAQLSDAIEQFSYYIERIGEMYDALCVMKNHWSTIKEAL